MALCKLSGYGPSNRLLFDGDELKYELWEIKFLGYLRTKKLSYVLQSENSVEGRDRVKDNELIFAELVQMLDDKSLALVFRDAKDDGCLALKILRTHYVGSSKPRIIALYTELTSLKKSSDESDTDFIIRAETAANSLKNCDEVISDGLLIAMVLKGLPDEYKQFATVINQKDKVLTFIEFKSALRCFEESEKCRKSQNTDDTVMKANYNNNSITCYSCGKRGHKKFQCTSKSTSNTGSEAPKSVGVQFVKQIPTILHFAVKRIILSSV